MLEKIYSDTQVKILPSGHYVPPPHAGAHLPGAMSERVKMCRVFMVKKGHIKEHVQRKHFSPNQSTLIDHIKISRNNQNEISKKEHWHDSL